MKKLRIIFLLVLIPLHNTFPHLAPVLESDKELFQIYDQIGQRWEVVKNAVHTFSPYENKSEVIIIEEYKHLDTFRKKLWHVNPKISEVINNPNYKTAPHLFEIKTFTQFPYLFAFDYNCIDHTYNASNLFVDGYHFIALEEPMLETLDAFFTLLINQSVRVLVRLKPEGEYASRGSISYWEDRLVQGSGYELIFLSYAHSIPYCYTNKWVDNEPIEVPILYDLVQKVRKAYADRGEDGPIACHCSAGVGRTGTFIAAYVLANLLDLLDPSQISIEEIILKLSVQRPHMVSTAEQYLTLYEFVDYYLEQKKNSISNEADKHYNL